LLCWIRWGAARGWFGTLTLPRVIELGNITHDDGQRDLFLKTPPLPELSALRLSGTGASTSMRVELPAVPGGGDGTPGAAVAAVVPLRPALEFGRSAEVLARFETPPPSADGGAWDFGIQLLWSGDSERQPAQPPLQASEEAEYTRVGVRDGTLLPGIDLWDEVNGDRSRIDRCASHAACRQQCGAQAWCQAWTWTMPGNSSATAAADGGVCRLKASAARVLLVTHGSPGCFLPTHGNWGGGFSWSGFMQQRRVRFAALYIERNHSWPSSPTDRTGNGSSTAFGHFGYAQLLRIVPTDATIDVHAYVDRSILEVFANGGRAAVTARVYPWRATSDRLAVFNRGRTRVSVNCSAWQMARSNVSRLDVLRTLSPHH
jgi:hypothetical protein